MGASENADFACITLDLHRHLIVMARGKWEAMGMENCANQGHQQLAISSDARVKRMESLTSSVQAGR